MKIQLLSCLLLFLCINLNAQEEKSTPVAFAPAAVTENATVDNGMRWDHTTHDFGTIPLGKPQTAEFILSNTGDEPLIVSEVKSSCGCTAGKHTEGPVMPGESTTITATYNAKKPGPFRKTVRVSTNRSDQPIPLTVTGEVSKEE